MRLTRIFILFYVLLNGLVCESQYKDTNFSYAFMYVHGTNSAGLPFDNDMTFNIISFLPNHKAEIYLKFIINGAESRIISYYIEDSLLTLEIGDNSIKYKIIEKNESRLILNQGDNVYNLNRILGIKNHDFILKGDSITSTNIYDTLDSYQLRQPNYRGDLYKVLKKNLSPILHRDTSYLIDVDFILRRNGSIDSIQLNYESQVNSAIKEMVMSTNNKWNVAEIEGKREDHIIKLTIFIPSNEIDSLELKNAYNLIKRLFNLGYNAINDNQTQIALYYFSECEKFYDSYVIMQKYSTFIDNNNGFLREIWVSSIINQALIFDSEGNYLKACEKLRKISSFDKVAYDRYKSYCNNK
jgi:hypothetical protein